MRRCVTGRQRVDLVRISHFMRQLIHLDGSERRPTGHHSIFDFRRIFPQLGLGAVVLRLAIVPVVVPIRQRSPVDQSVDGRDRHNLHTIQHYLSDERQSHFGNSQLQSGK